MVEGIDRDGVAEIEKTLNKPPQTESERKQEDRQRAARDNRNAVGNLADAFALGRM